MKKFFIGLGRFTTKLVSLLVICGFVSLACLPIVYAEKDDTDLGDAVPSSEGCHPKAEESSTSVQSETDDSNDDTTDPVDPDPSTPANPDPSTPAGPDRKSVV